ncbi:hypothetical protein EYC84_006960 [Monilinia fructicola]|uniref:Uncharacterized protein n=1 Tax=Monilinia fructicola TaxID=38448 RepID=A0A5M9KD94_MONFR|nr:hypothetical protein EYC84_006960 [Monilinia fructicola]
MLASPSSLNLVGLRQGPANGVQAIVDLQFRKEIRALLNLFEDLKTKVEESSADAERRVEESRKQLEETENRLTRLENECHHLAQKNREWEDELKDLKGKMKKLGESMRADTHVAPTSRSLDLLEEARLQQPQKQRIGVAGHGRVNTKYYRQCQRLPAHYRTDVADLQHELISTITSSQVALEMPAVRQQISNSIGEEINPDLRYTSTLLLSNTAVNNLDNHPLYRHESNQAIPSSLAQNIQTSLLSPPSPLPLPRTIEGHQSLRGGLSQKATSHKVVNPPPWINISQARDQDVESYLTYGAECIGPIKQRNDQYEFIARFIGGLQCERNRDALLKQLRKKFSSRTTKDGFVEVMCGFADVGDAMEASGLLRRKNRKREGDDAGMSSVQKKRSSLESQMSEGM